MRGVNREQTKVTVEGSGYFPVDMLRYDQAYPYQQCDSGQIAEGTGKRKVVLICNGAPTDPRWQSFCWRVVKVEKI